MSSVLPLRVGLDSNLTGDFVDLLHGFTRCVLCFGFEGVWVSLQLRTFCGRFER